MVRKSPQGWVHGESAEQTLGPRGHDRQTDRMFNAMGIKDGIDVGFEPIQIRIVRSMGYPQLAPE
ncbi:hypothetical protein BFR47_00390 [Oceanisphaera psychrotolerans]|uniref:Uncharacterized protein n=1 Tax=Oceanisphaera psychrotolerans TaxID=1414654 RepID=A0A1J4QFG5_9GAMM|nr:hypothetical protein BFR47_00390 [Oceanisphaera psychrotolerans]